MCFRGRDDYRGPRTTARVPAPNTIAPLLARYNVRLCVAGADVVGRAVVLQDRLVRADWSMTAESIRRVARRCRDPSPIHSRGCRSAACARLAGLQVCDGRVPPESQSAEGRRHFEWRPSWMPLTMKIVPVIPFSGRPPSAGGLKRGSRHVPVQVGEGSIFAPAWVSL